MKFALVLIVVALPVLAYAQQTVPQIADGALSAITKNAALLNEYVTQLVAQNDTLRQQVADLTKERDALKLPATPEKQGPPK
jgi:hypothetical protein